jgi:hypothetical protein
MSSAGSRNTGSATGAELEASFRESLDQFMSHLASGASNEQILVLLDTQSGILSKLEEDPSLRAGFTPEETRAMVKDHRKWCAKFYKQTKAHMSDATPGDALKKAIEKAEEEEKEEGEGESNPNCRVM